MEIAEQIQFENLEDFIRSKNNFHVYFIFPNESLFTGHYRHKEVFKRFIDSHPEMDRELVDRIANARERADTNGSGLVEELSKEDCQQLWDAYKVMSKLVYIEDKGVLREEEYEKPDRYFLIR